MFTVYTIITLTITIVYVSMLMYTNVTLIIKGATRNGYKVHRGQ